MVPRCVSSPRPTFNAEAERAIGLARSRGSTRIRGVLRSHPATTRTAAGAPSTPADDGGVQVDTYSAAGPCTVFMDPIRDAAAGLHPATVNQLAVVSTRPVVLLRIRVRRCTSDSKTTTRGERRTAEPHGTQWDVAATPESSRSILERHRNWSADGMAAAPCTAVPMVSRQKTTARSSETFSMVRTGNRCPPAPTSAKSSHRRAGSLLLPVTTSRSVRRQRTTRSSEVSTRNRTVVVVAQRTRTGTVWTRPHLRRGASDEVRAVGGSAATPHTNPWVYVLTCSGLVYACPSNGTLRRGQVDGTGHVATWTPLLTNVANFYADPYNANVVYAMTDSGIRSYNNATGTWTIDTALSAIATNYGEYLLGTWCNAFRICSLTGMSFSPTDSKIRVAALGLGGVAFSRDSGAHWIQLSGAIQKFDATSSVYYDPQINPATRTPSIYVSSYGDGVHRLDAPFTSLEGIAVTFHSTATHTPSRSRTTRREPQASSPREAAATSTARNSSTAAKPSPLHIISLSMGSRPQRLRTR